MDLLDDESRELRLEQLQQLAGTLSQQCQQNATKKAEIESRWLEDMRQKHGRYDPETESKLEDAGGSKAFSNATRRKCKVAKSRLSDVVLPADERNYAVSPTPIPELVNAKEGEMIAGPNGQPVEKRMLAAAVEAEAKEAAERMAKLIDDQLTEARYGAKCRDVIDDAVDLGTGILKGPVVVGKARKKWEIDPQTGTTILTVVQDLEPGVEQVSPWNFYPDMSAACIDDAEFIYERHPWTKKKLREFAQLPGVITDQVEELLKQEARATWIVSDYSSEKREISGVQAQDSHNLYEVWSYHGPIKKSDLVLCGCEGIDEDDVLTEYEGIIWFCGNSVLKAALNPLETEEREYSVFCWEPDESSIFGYGVPYLMRNPQKGMNAAWRMMMDNGAFAVAPQLVIDETLIQPYDGQWRLSPKKLWKKVKKISNPGEKPFEAFETPCNLAALKMLYDMAKQQADEETNLPLIAEGEQDSTTTKTLGGMSILMQSAMVVFRSALKSFDDDVIVPFITRMYDYNMQNHGDVSVKGDYKVKARGSTALLVKELQQQLLAMLADIGIKHPEYNRRLNWDVLVPAHVRSMQVTNDDVLLTKEQIKEREANQPEPPIPPEIEIKQMDLELKREQMAMDQQRFEQELDQKRELELVKIAANENIKLSELQHRVGLDNKKQELDEAQHNQSLLPPPPSQENYGH